MNQNRLTFLAFLLAIVIAAPGCRSRAVKTPAPVAAPEATATRAVEAPTTDFVTTDPEPVRNALSNDEFNRVARDRGWIQDAFFGFDSSTLSADAQSALTASARWLRQNPGVRVVVEGHCDERGTEQYNLALGERRAYTARQYLTALGVDPSLLSQVSYGEERPFEEGSSEAAWRLNRRAHLRVEQP